MSIIEILEGKRAWYELKGHSQKASATQAQITAIKQSWVKAMHSSLAKERSNEASV